MCVCVCVCEFLALCICKYVCIWVCVLVCVCYIFWAEREIEHFFSISGLLSFTPIRTGSKSSTRVKSSKSFPGNPY